MKSLRGLSTAEFKLKNSVFAHHLFYPLRFAAYGRKAAGDRENE